MEDRAEYVVDVAVASPSAQYGAGLAALDALQGSWPDRMAAAATLGDLVQIAALVVEQASFVYARMGLLPLECVVQRQAWEERWTLTEAVLLALLEDGAEAALLRADSAREFAGLSDKMVGAWSAAEAMVKTSLPILFGGDQEIRARVEGFLASLRLCDQENTALWAGWGQAQSTKAPG